MNRINIIFARWHFRLAMAVGVSIIAVLLAIGAVFVLPDNIFQAPGRDDLHVNAILNCLLAFFLLAGQFFMNAIRSGKAIMTFGFAPTRFAFIHAISGFGISLVLVALLFSLFLLSGTHATFAGFQPERLMLQTTFIFCAALIEELIFRGLLYEPFSEKFGEVKTAIVISLLFAAAHILNPSVSLLGIINVALAGILLTAMRIASRALWMPFAFHFGWNWLLGVVFGLPVSGNIFPASILTTTISDEHSLWLGGGFGVEEGLLTTILLLISTLFVLLYTKSDPYISAAEFRRRFEEDKLLNPISSST